MDDLFKPIRDTRKRMMSEGREPWCVLVTNSGTYLLPKMKQSCGELYGMAVFIDPDYEIVKVEETTKDDVDETNHDVDLERYVSMTTGFYKETTGDDANG